MLTLTYRVTSRYGHLCYEIGNSTSSSSSDGGSSSSGGGGGGGGGGAGRSGHERMVAASWHEDQGQY